MPWLDTPRAGFMSALEHFWIRYASGRHTLMLIAAGSATAWMLDNLVNNNGGLYDRTSRDIHVHPFSLSETETYFQKRNILMDRYDIAQSYMIVGGVPYYLSLFEKGKSLAQNIDAVFFERGNKRSRMSVSRIRNKSNGRWASREFTRRYTLGGSFPKA